MQRNHGNPSSGRGKESSDRLGDPAFLHHLLHTAPHGVTQIDLHGRIVYANRPMHRMLGDDDGPLIGRVAFDLIADAQDRQRARDLIDRALAENFTPEPFLCRIARRDGSAFHAQIDWNYLRDEAGALIGFVTMIIDIDDRLAADAELRASRQRYHHLFTVIPDGVVIIDGATSRFLDANGAALDMYGHSLEDFRRLTPVDLSADPQQTATAFDRLLDQQAIHIPLRYQKRRDGSVFPVEISGGTCTVNGRRLAYGIVRDISRRLWAQQQLHHTIAQLNQLHAAINRGPIVVFRWRLVDDWPVEFVSQNVSRFGHRAEDFTSGRVSWSQIVHADDLDRVRLQTRQCVASNREAFSRHYRLVTAAGEVRWIEDHNLLIRDEAGASTHLEGILLDATERREAERRAAESRDQLAHLLRRHTLDRMAGELVHELSQPLSALTHYAETCAAMIGQTDADTAQLAEPIREIAAQARRCIAMVQGIRAMVRRHEPLRVETDPASLVDQVIGLVERELINHRIKFKRDLPAEPQRIWADPVQFQQVLLNLVRNAIDAMTDQTASPAQLILAVRPVDGMVRFTVADTGRGLADADAETLFRPFFTTKPDGIGMGLAISRSLVEAHGGKLWLEPNADRGLTVHFTMPARLSPDAHDD